MWPRVSSRWIREHPALNRINVFSLVIGLKEKITVREGGRGREEGEGGGAEAGEGGRGRAVVVAIAAVILTEAVVSVSVGGNK